MRTVIAGISLVYRLGARHDDLAGRASALNTGRQREAGWILGTFSPVRAGRADPGTCFPEEPAKRAVPHGGCDPLVFPRALALCGRGRIDRTTLRELLPVLAGYHGSPRAAARGSISTWTRRDALLIPGPAGLPTHLDGNSGGPASECGPTLRAEGRRWRSNALWYEGDALTLIGSLAGGGKRQKRRRLPGAGAARAKQSFQRTGSGARKYRASLLTWWMASTGTNRACRDPNPGVSPFRCPNPVLDREHSEPVMAAVKRRIADTVRPALPLAPRPGLQAAKLPRRPGHAGCGLPPGHGLALADRIVRGRHAQRCIREDKAGA